MAKPNPIKIPHTRLSPAALSEVIHEFVTRDGTDHSIVKQRVLAVMNQLEDGRVELHFDSATSSTNIVSSINES